jgi:hypothetical protein
LDFGLTPTTRVRGLGILNFGFGIFSAHQGRGMNKKKSKIGNLKSKIGTVNMTSIIVFPDFRLEADIIFQLKDHNIFLDDCIKVQFIEVLLIMIASIKAIAFQMLGFIYVCDRYLPN